MAKHGGKRIFIGITVDRLLYPKIESLKQKLLEISLRWIRNKNLHITLIPPWYEDEKGIEKRITDIKKGIAGIKKFEISFNKVRLSPNRRIPRLIWAEGEADERIILLVKKLEGIIGKKPENRGFKLHLTLARFRKTPGSPSVKSIKKAIAWKQSVNSLCLLESRLSSKGADYLLIREIKIGK